MAKSLTTAIVAGLQPWGGASTKKELRLQGVDSGRGWTTLFSSERWPGGWQQDSETLADETLLRYGPVYACATLIAADIAKICLRLMELQQGVWVESVNSAYSPVLRKPNHYQTRQQYIECWMLSKLFDGNSYSLKLRDGSRKVRELFVLDPKRVTPLVAPGGDVYYRLHSDELSKLPNDMPAVPASEIIHDRMDCLFHPLVGVSPLFAVALSASKGWRIEKNAERFFRNQSQPGGMLTAPEQIDDETAARLKREFEQNFSGENRYRLFVGGDGLKYDPIRETAINSQLVEQLKLSAEQVCSVFHVPAYMIGVGQVPSYDNVEALTQQYYQQCLQRHFNAIEDLLDDALGLIATPLRVEFELDDLLRMDSSQRAEVTERLIKSAVLSPDEARAKFGYLPVPGGKWPLIQQQNFSLEALAKRDAKDDPFATSTPAPKPSEEKPSADDEEKAALETARLIAAVSKGLEHV